MQKEQTPTNISPPRVLEYGRPAPIWGFRPRAWNSVMLGAIALLLVGSTPLIDRFLTDKGEDAGLVSVCFFFPLLIAVMVTGVGSAIRSLRAGPARLVAIWGLFLNLAPIWTFPLLTRLTH